MKRDEISNASSALANQLNAGIPLDQAVGRLAILQPRRATFWRDARRYIQFGGRLSDVLKVSWPENFIAAIRAGERANKLPEVFLEVERSIQTEIIVVSMMRKLIYPIGLVTAGLVIFLGFMVFVMPSFAKSVPQKEWGLVFHLSTALEGFFKERWWMALAGAAAIFVGLYRWLSSPEGRAQLLNFLIDLPGVGNAMRYLYFGLWSSQMALIAGAGIGTLPALDSTAYTLPPAFREAILAVKEDVSSNNKKLSEAFDPECQEEGDPRRWLPFYVTNAFIIAEQTGQIQSELSRVAPAMVNEGIKIMTKVSSYANMAAMAIAAQLIMSPMAVYYMQVFDSMARM